MRSGATAGRPTRSTPAPRPAGATSPRTSGRCTTSTRTAPRCHDLADKHPELLDELIELWHFEAGQYFGLPLDDRSALEMLTTPAAADDRAARPLRLLPGHARGAGGGGRQRARALVQDRRRGRPPDRDAARRPVRARQPCSVGTRSTSRTASSSTSTTTSGEKEQVVTSDEADSDRQVRARRRVHQGRSQTPVATIGHRSRCTSTTSRSASSTDVKTQLGKFTLCGEGLNIGRDGGAAGHRRLPGRAALGLQSAATIERVIVDVSGEAYVDLEKEAMAMMSRD